MPTVPSLPKPMPTGLASGSARLSVRSNTAACAEVGGAGGSATASLCDDLSAEGDAASDAEVAATSGASLVVKISARAFVTSDGDFGPESP